MYMHVHIKYYVIVYKVLAGIDIYPNYNKHNELIFMDTKFHCLYSFKHSHLIKHYVLQMVTH